MALLLRGITERCGDVLGWLFLIAVNMLGAADMHKYDTLRMCS